MKLVFLDNFKFQRLLDVNGPVEPDIEAADEVIELERLCKKHKIQFLTYYNPDELRFVIVKQKLKVTSKQSYKILIDILTKFDFDYKLTKNNSIEFFEQLPYSKYYVNH